jgi:hypothetical protein
MPSHGGEHSRDQDEAHAPPALSTVGHIKEMIRPASIGPCVTL